MNHTWQELAQDVVAGRWSEAADRYCAFSGSGRQGANLWHDLGRDLAGQGLTDAAGECLAEALSLDRKNEAILEALRRILNLGPGSAPLGSPKVAALMALASWYVKRGRREKALLWFREAQAAAPGDALVLSNLGATLIACAQFDEAVSVLSEATALRPDLAEAHLNLGAALQSSGQHDLAIAAYQRAASCGCPPAVVSFNIATAREAQGDISAAIRGLDRAIELDPAYANARRNRGLLQLMSGRWDLGWSDYEWRWRCADQAGQQRPFPQPWWNGRNATRSILLWGEQGIGDEILYSGLARFVSEVGLRVTLEVDPRLVGMFSRAMRSIEVVARTPIPAPRLLSDEFDVQLPLGSLPGVLSGLGVRFDADWWGPYAKPDPGQSMAFARRFRATSRKPTASVSWRSFNPQFGANKSIPIDDVAGLLTAVDLQWVDVQYGDVADDRATLARTAGPVMRPIPGVDAFSDLESVASALVAGDLVVTASNVIAHLAGALGLQAWILVPASTSKLWYWGAEGDRCLWYPSLRLFRQRVRDSWREPLDAVASELGMFARVFAMSPESMAEQDIRSE